MKLLENLSAIKARHAALCAQVQEIEAEQKQSMDSIRAHLGTTVQLVQQLQQSADEEVAFPLLCLQTASRNAACVPENSAFGWIFLEYVCVCVYICCCC